MGALMAAMAVLGIFYSAQFWSECQHTDCWPVCAPVSSDSRLMVLVGAWWLGTPLKGAGTDEPAEYDSWSLRLSHWRSLGRVGSGVRGHWYAGWSAPTGGSVGHGPIETLFLGLILSVVPMTPCDTMLYCILLYWPHPSALVAYNGGTNGSHGRFSNSLLSLILVPVPAHWILVGVWPGVK